MTYREEILRTINSDFNSIRDRLSSPNSLKLLNALVGLAGESGEALDLMKKLVFHGTPLDEKKLLNELGDVRYYLELALSVLNKDIKDIEEMNSDKLRKRYPEGFSERAAVERKDIS